ncbi:MAG: ABC transporter permease [Kibdelosporangium sp.]
MSLSAVGRAAAVTHRGFRVYRRHWMILVFGVLEPLLYLVSIGVGVGNMIGGADWLPDGGYAEYVAAGLLAVAAMNAATNASVLTVFTRIKVEHTYTIMLSTPLDSRDIAVGEVFWATARATVESTGFLAVIVAFGLVTSPWAVLAVGSVALIGVTFAALGLVVATAIRDWPDFQAVQLVMLPMFLFATTFYPLDVYPAPIRALVVCLPLYHAIEVTRAPMMASFDGSVLISFGYLVILAALSLRCGIRRLTAKLVD